MNGEREEQKPIKENEQGHRAGREKSPCAAVNNGVHNGVHGVKC